MSSRTIRGRARHFRGTGAGDPADSPYGRIGQMEAIGEGEQRPTQTNVNAWNSYVGASQRLQQLQDAAIGAGKARYTRDNTAIKWDRQADLSRARALRTTIYEYRQNQSSCNAGVAGACSRVGRRNPNDEQYINPSQRSYQDYNLYTHQEGNMDAAETPGDIMGGGAAAPTPAPTPAPVDNREQSCAASGGRYDADRGVCFQEAPVIPSVLRPGGRRGDESGEQRPHVEDPTERTGEQVPETHDRHDDQQHRSTDSGGGIHSGSDNTKSHAGSEEVCQFDSGAGIRGLARQENPVRQTLNQIRALTDPYGEFRKCKTEKKLVE